jgi:hypothetical protein
VDVPFPEKIGSCLGLVKLQKKMTKKCQIRQSSQKNQDDEYLITDRMPAWVRQFLANTGIDREFNLSKLSQDQWLAIELAERLCQLEKEGLIRVTFDPDIHPEPQVELTDYGRTKIER